MEKITLYRTALDAAVYIRQFMFRENFYSRELDDALQPFIRYCLDSVRDSIPEPKKDEKND